MIRPLVILGALNALLGILLRAFGAHGLEGRLAADRLAAFYTGTEYHLYHALGLIGLGLLAAHCHRRGLLLWAGGLMVAGIVLFSGSLYLLAVSGARWWGAATPFGGASFIVAWALAAAAVWRSGSG
jgi:uncharacterized membrane protein YgdD (TMEM256/DUF423 family)